MDAEEKVPMIPKHQAQAEMMHMSWTIRWLIIAIAVGFVCMVVQAYIFVSNYTARTNEWLNTLTHFKNQPAATEVTDEKEPSGVV